MDRKDSPDRCSLVPLMPRPERRLRCSEAGDGDAEGRAGNVVEADLLAELDRGRVAAVLAANAELQRWAGLAPAIGGKADKLADALAVEGDERVAGEDAALGIGAEEGGGIV